MRPWTLVFIFICLLTILASGPDSKNIAPRAEAGDCSKDCGAGLPWYDYDPACCAFKQPPHHYYQRDDRTTRDGVPVPPGKVRCYERLKICETWFTGHNEIVDQKKGCPKDPVFEKPPGDLLVCCTEWAKAIKSGKPCNPAESPNCIGEPPGRGFNDPFNDIPYLEEHKPDYIWVSGASGSAKIYDCINADFDTKLLTVELNGTMLKVDNHEKPPGGKLFYWVRGDKGGKTFSGCIRPEDVVCDPAKVRK